MAFAGKDVLPDKKTGFTFRGKPILLTKTRGSPHQGRSIMGRGGWYPEEKKHEALAVFAATGSIKKTHELSGVSQQTLKSWLKQEWALELLEEIRNENDYEIDSRFHRIVNSALEKVEDRIENGDFVVARNGELIRKPMSGKDLTSVAAMNFDKRQLLRGKPTSRTENTSTEATLKKLEKVFLELAGKKSIKTPETITDVEFSHVPTPE